MASSASFHFSCAARISTAAYSGPPALTALRTADSVTANCSVGGLPAQAVSSRPPSAMAASLGSWNLEAWVATALVMVSLQFDCLTDSYRPWPGSGLIRALPMSGHIFVRPDG